MHLRHGYVLLKTESHIHVTYVSFPKLGCHGDQPAPAFSMSLNLMQHAGEEMEAWEDGSIWANNADSG